LMRLRAEGTEPRVVMVTKAAVLCGGEGTRLRPHTNNRQKTMIPIGTKHRPLLEYVVRLIVYNGVSRITLLTGYMSEQVEGYFGDGKKFGAEIGYSKDAGGTRGSASALVNAIDGGKIGPFDSLLVYYGDILSTLTIRELVAKHEKTASAVTLVLARDYKVPVGIAQVEGDRVVGFQEKPTLPLSVTVGGLVLSKEAIPVLRRVTEAGGTDIMTDFVPAAIEQGLKVSPFYIDDFWYDVGTTESYEKLDGELVDRKLSFLE
jgi:NDP-mannose synthase